MGVLPKRKRNTLLLGDDSNALIALIAINAMAFVIINFIKIGYFLSGLEVEAFYRNVLAWLLVPANPDSLLARPWSVFTYMFSHEGVWHMISNMLWLWAFGFILQDLAGNRHLAPLYLYGGWVGAAMFLLTINIFPVLQQARDTIAPLQGGGAAIMAIAVGTTALAPNYRLFPMLNGGIPLWVLTLVFVLVDYALIASVGAGTAVAHLSGGAVGLLYIRALQRGANWGEWMHQFYHWFFTLFDPKKPNRQQAKQKMHYKAGPVPPFRSRPHVTEQRIDEILDKINTQGYHMLTEEEKEYLKRASNEDL